MDIDSQVLHSELVKAKKRLVEQTSVWSSCSAIVSSAVALPSLKAVAARRLPKLTQVREETLQVIRELETALLIGKQPDLLDTKPAEKSARK